MSLAELLERAHALGHLISWRACSRNVTLVCAEGRYAMTPRQARTYLRTVVHLESSSVMY
ncbi:MAG: hypothetical protein AAF089_02320 [Bacteroidota bacterium]